MDIWIPILCAIVTGVFGFLGNWISNRKNSAVIEYRLKSLEEETREQNKETKSWKNEVTDRVYKLEESVTVQGEHIKNLDHRITAIEKA